MTTAGVFRRDRVDGLLRHAVRVAAIVYLPAMYLHLTVTDDAWATVATALWWVVWLPFAGELLAGIALAGDRREFLRHHRLLLFTVCFGFPLLPYVLRPIPGLGLLAAVGVLDLLDVHKLGKMLGILRREGPSWVVTPAASLVLGTAAFGLALSALGAVLDRAHWTAAPEPLRYLGSILDGLLHHPSLEADALLVVAALVFAVGVMLWRRPLSRRIGDGERSRS